MTVSAIVRTTLIIDEIRYAFARSSTRSTAYAASRFVKLQIPSAVSQISVAS